MEKLDKILDKGMRFLMAMAMLSLVAGGFWQIFTRWILKNPSTFTEEFMRYMLIWSSMIGSAYCFYKEKHLTLDLFKRKAKGVPGIILAVFIEGVILFFISYVFIYGGGRLMMNSTNYSPVMGIPYQFLYLVLPLSGIFVVVARILKYIEAFNKSKKSKEVK